MPTIPPANPCTRLRFIDSHTAGEPTRLIVGGGPDFGAGTLARRLVRFRTDYDHLRSAVVNEPRGSGVVVGAWLCAPEDPACAAGVIFFNNVGYLGMCGHGVIGLVATLAHMGRLQPGAHRIETPVGEVRATLHAEGDVTVANVVSYRSAQVMVEVPGYGAVSGDVAWGGNWFFLTHAGGRVPVAAAHLESLTAYAWAIRQALTAQGIRGDDGGEIDHIEIFAPPAAGGDARSFVLCPGKEYDRSPCGTGTSAKLACLYADGKLRPGQTWKQESVIGTVFAGSVEVAASDPHPGAVSPSIRGAAFITAEGELLLDPADPFRHGIRA